MCIKRVLLFLMAVAVSASVGCNSSPESIVVAQSESGLSSETFSETFSGTSGEMQTPESSASTVSTIENTSESLAESVPRSAEESKGTVATPTETITVAPPTTSAATSAAITAATEHETSALITTSTITAAKPQTDSIDISLNIANSWESGANKFFQLDAVVKNTGTVSVSGWTVSIPVAKTTEIDQYWNCSVKYENETLTVTPVSHNKDIAANGSVTFGMILCNAGEIDAQEADIGQSEAAVTTAPSSNSGSVGNNNPEIVQAKEVPAPTTDDWLYVKGNKIVDGEGREVWLTGTNWFGYNTGTNTFDGLWACDMNTTIASIADRGFNLLRVPISTELIKEWSNGKYPSANFNQAINSYLVGLNSLEIFDYAIGQCRANGLKIMIDIHSAKTDAMGHMKNVWYEGDISEKDFLDALTWIAKRYANDDTIIAYDLKNEPHGKPNETPRAKWDNSKDPDNWKYIAEKAANAVFAGNPNALVMVEGIEIYPIDINKNGDFSSKNSADYFYNWWGGNLRGVRDNPINLGKYQNKLVYSPHDYGPSVYEQPWFKGGYTYESLYSDCWYDNWFYIQKEGIAPLLIGEWGGFMSEPNLTWMTYLRKLIKENRINHTFWCFNANSGDTGGLVLDDFKTWDEDKYSFVKEVLWQKNGKFVGLDHKIPLGRNGITLS